MIGTGSELSAKAKRKLRQIIGTYYDVQDVRERTEQRINDYAEEEALAACIGEEEVQKLRLLPDHNQSYKAALRDRKFTAKEEKAIKEAGSLYDHEKAHPEDAERVKFARAFMAAAAELQDEKRHKTVAQEMFHSETLCKTLAMDEIENHPLWIEWLSHVRGIGPCLAGGILAWINIEKCLHVGNLWSYAGQTVTIEKYICAGCNVILDPDKVPSLEERVAQGGLREAPRCPKCNNFLRVMGHAVRREKGKKLGYNPAVKTLAWKIGESFVKCSAEKSGYRRLYDQFRERIEAKVAANNGFCHKIHKDKEGKLINGGKCFNAHVYAMAKRATVKIFLSHVYKRWRDLLGLPTTPPFPFGMMGHDMSGYIEPIVDPD